MADSYYLLTQIRNAQALLAGQEEHLREAKTPQDRMSAMEEIRRQKQTVLNLRAEWLSRNPGKQFPLSVKP